MSRLLALALPAGLLLALMAGCLDPSNDPAQPAPIPPMPVAPVVAISSLVDAVPAMAFEQSVVSPAQGIAADLYEPTMEVSDTGTLYVAAHVLGAATTGTPAWYSTDDGASWTQLPFVGPVSAPPPVQGAQPPPGDEGFIVAGDDGTAWMADIYAAGFSVTGWCDDGASQCYDNRYAYDRIASTSEMCADGVDPQASTAASLNDRPWAAYAPGVGTLLLVNNPGGGPMQLGAMRIPPATPVGGFDPVTGPRWNLCASPDGWIPGVPAMRGDGFFAVPQMTGSGEDERLTVVVGNVDDIFAVEVVDVFHVSTDYGGTSNGGRSAFDGTGSLFLGAYNNSKGADSVKDKGKFILAASTDDGHRFVNVTFETETPVRSLYLDSNLKGPGALLTWSQLGSSEDVSDWYVAHLNVGPGGEPVLSHVTRAVQDGPHSSAHVMGASVGPDGRAYFVNFQDAPAPLGYLGSTPLSVWIQRDGPTLSAAMAPTPEA
ncbi:MAG TPA: hypothetical protein VM327_02510 [Candidatus Thermoplasmatota archaeon]|nr:hypothetical protein [Candidatus Thermoplasmatota archaeon]